MPETFKPFLSHYTSRAGLEGIAKSKSLWATNFLDLNDTSEYIYAWSILTRDAMEIAIERVPAEERRPDFDLVTDAKAFAAKLRTTFADSDGYNNLYVASFARAANEDQDERGILTIWDRYTKHEGYCLQFDRRQIEHLVELDATRENFSLFGVREVSYGIDKSTAAYQELRYQMAQSALLQMVRARPDIRVEPDLDHMWPMSRLAAELSMFCATHKDPCFEDEREVRVIVYPADRAESRFLVGFASRKKIHFSPDGKRHIALGEHWRPGIEPMRIIVGEKASRDVETIEAMFDRRPAVAFANLPLA